MVNSFGARKKAPYADALRRMTTAAAPRTLLVMIFLDLRCPSPVSPFWKCFFLIQIPNPILQTLCFHTDSRNRGGGGHPAKPPGLILPRDIPRKAIPPSKK